MIFEFQLAPIQNVHPWGESGNKNIHWFALTQGDYRLRVGSEYLFNYSEEYTNYCIKNFPPYRTKNTTHVDYYVVCLWEDLITVLRNLFETVPKELQPFLKDYKTYTALYEKSEIWHKTQLEKLFDKEEAWEIIEFVSDWWQVRCFDSMYLTNAPHIWFWSDEDDVVISWDNREIEVEGIPVWSATHGNYRISRNDFINEVREFDKSLISEMNQRVETICRDWQNPEITIDREQLKGEQRYRATCMETWLKGGSNTDWDKVISAIKLVNE